MTAKPGVFNRPKIEVYIGVTGSGKGVSVNARLDELAPTRLLMWDPRNEYGKRAPAYDTLPGLIGAFRGAKAGPVRARYVPNERSSLADQFAVVCTLAMTAGNLVFVAEELSDVTTASWAPPAWKKVLVQGRHMGLHIFPVCQRPALMDKTAFGMATYIRCFMLGTAPDRKTMATELDADEADVRALRTSERVSGTTIHTEIQYIERFKREGVTKPVQSIHKSRKGAPEEIAEILAQKARIGDVSTPQRAVRKARAT
jgi:hypothetical protein